MLTLIAIGVGLLGLCVGAGCWLGLQLLRQNGRVLLHLDALRERLAAPPTPSPPVLHAAPDPTRHATDAALALPDPIYGRILQRLEALEQRLDQLGPAPAPGPPAGLPIGSAAPGFELPDLAGRRVSLADFRGRDLLLIFFNPGCGFCTQMAPDLAALPVDGGDHRPLPLVVTAGSVETNQKLVEEHGIRGPVLLQEGDVASRYQCNGTPMGYLIDAQGNIASELVVGAQALLALAQAPSTALNDAAATAGNGNGHAPLGGKRSLEESRIERNGLPAGTPAPEFRLPLLYGGELALSDYRGRQVLLVFSDPNCGPCDTLVPQLEQAARRTPHMQVLMVSRGDEEANRVKAAQHGLTFPVVLQRQWEISREYGIFATPVAYLIDEVGVLASDVTVGVEPILALLASAAAPADPAAARCRCGKLLGQCQCGKQKPKVAAGRRNGR